MLIFVASSRLEALRSFLNVLSMESDVSIQSASSGKEALDAVTRKAPAVMVVDVVDDMSALELVAGVLTRNAFVNMAVVSDLSEEAFHEQSEGLGVLMRLDDPPAPLQAAELIQKINALAP